jgi:xanthine dehydrogenase accessory factor
LIRKEWFCPQPKLILCGGGHVSREVAAFAHRLDFSVAVLDDRPDAVTRERFPTAERICDSYENLGKYLEEDACYVVVTPDHKADLQCVSTILPTRYRYLGMIGSRKKVASTIENLKNAGFSQEKISSMFAPIGLSIGAVTPAEIALSILGQIVQEKNKTHAASAEKALLEVTESGILCVITEKHGSAPRGVGSMMFVGQDQVFGSIGGGEPEYLAIRHAKENHGFDLKEYTLNNTAANGLDMICGGRITVMFIPV